MKNFYISALISFLIAALVFGLAINEINNQPDQDELLKYIIHINHQPKLYETTGQIV